MKPTAIFIAILFALLVVLQYKLWVSPEGGVMRFWKLRQDISQVNKENAVLQERNLRVAAEVKDLKEGIEAIEERARDDFGLIKPGEVFYQIVD